MKIFKGLVLVSLLCVSSAYAATTGSLTLTGTIAPLLSISVTPTAAASTLDLVNGETATIVANISEISNAASGYTVTVSSANAGKLVNQTLNTQTVDYTVSYGGQAMNLSSDQTYVDNNPGTGLPNNKDLSIDITGSSTLAAGDYVDEITFTIAAN